MYGKSWAKISKKCFNNRRSDVACMSEFAQVLNPEIRHGAWKEKETAKLIELRESGLTWEQCAQDSIMGEQIDNA